MTSPGRAVAFVALLVTAPAYGDCPRGDRLASEADALVAVNLDEAISHDEQAHQAAPSSHVILWKLARLYETKEDWEKAAVALDEACKLAPTFASYAYERGRALAALVRNGHRTSHAEASAAFERAITLDPGYGAPHRELARLLIEESADARALDELTKAITLRPDDVASYVLLADFYFRLGYLDQAAQVAREGASWNPTPTDRFALLEIGSAALAEKGDVTAALAALEEARTVCYPCNVRGQQLVFFLLGELYMRTKPPRKSEALVQLQTFSKTVCRGAAAARYADQCAQTQDLVRQALLP
jgi:tetratricopeptide (TPR) repeat protein